MRVTVVGCALALLLTVSGGLGDEVIEGPVNTAAKYGENDVTLHCTVHLTSVLGMEWLYYPESEVTGERIYDSKSDEVTESLRDTFDVNSWDEDGGSGNTVFALIVKEVTKDLGGAYTCRMVANINSEVTAELVAVGHMTCLPEPGTVTVDDGQQAMLNCYVEFQGHEGNISPDVTWLSPDGNRPPETDHKNSTFVGVSTNVTAEMEYDTDELICLLDFHGAVEPDYTDNCTTWIYIRHAVGNIQFSPSPDDTSDGTVRRYVGEEVNCTADGRPEPLYTWILPQGGVRVPGPTLVTNKTMIGTSEYTCQANNTFQGQDRMAERKVYIMVQDDPEAGSGRGSRLQCTIGLYAAILFMVTELFPW